MACSLTLDVSGVRPASLVSDSTGVSPVSHTAGYYSRSLPFLAGKGRPHLRGEGGSSKADTCGRRGEGGSVAKSGRPQIQIFTEILEVLIVSCVLKDNI